MIKKNMKIIDILRKKPKAAEILLSKGMHCIYCPMAAQETLEEAAKVHGIDVKKLLEELNK